MEHDYLIFVDASCDTREQYFEEGAFGFVPMSYTLNGAECICTGKETDEDLCAFYNIMREGGAVKTSQITPAVYEDFFAPYLKEGKSVLYLSLSGAISSTYDSACHAAQSLKEKYPSAELYPVNSVAVSGMIGVTLEQALKNREMGMSVAENAEAIKRYTALTDGRCFVDDLKYVAKGGRIGVVTAFVGSILGIRPMIELSSEGTLDLYAKKKGAKKCVDQLVEDFVSRYDFEVRSSIYISDCDNASVADLLEERIRSICPDAVIRRKTVTPIIGIHLGPGTVTIAFQKKP